MRKTVIFLVVLTLVAFGADSVFAHGGQYRGPGDTVPPGTGPGGPTTPSGPSTPNAPSTPSTPGTPSPATPATPSTPSAPSTPSTGSTGSGPMRGARTQRATDMGPDLTQWDFWWEFNKEPYINLKKSIQDGGGLTGRSTILGGALGARRTTKSLKPSENQLVEIVTPALVRALEETDNKDIVSSCLVALAKIGKKKDLDTVLKEYITHNSQEVSETAILSFGIAQMAKVVPDLIEIFKDSARGRDLVGKANVHFRHRAFAAYSLGLIAYGKKDLTIKRTVFEAAKDVLVNSSKWVNRDIPVAAINAIRILNLDLDQPDEAKLAVEAVKFLMSYFNNLDNGYQMRAHVPTAVAKILGRVKDKSKQTAAVGEEGAKAPTSNMEELKRKCVAAFVKNITTKRQKKRWVQQSCVLALGQMANSSMQEVTKLLVKVADGKICKDQQAVYYAYISLAYIGGDAAQQHLVSKLVKRGKQRNKPWIALALGVLVREQVMAGKKNVNSADIGQVLLKAFTKTKNPQWRAAFAVALGLCSYQSSGPYLQDVIQNSKDPFIRGYCAIGLGLMEYTDAKPDLQAALGKAKRQGGLLKQIAIGLGLLKDRSIVDTLVKMLKEESSTLAVQSALATGLGFVGDQSAVNPLVDMLFNKDLANLSRAFAAVALGIVGDKEGLPWNTKIGFGLNYRANVETLTGNSTGILDLL